MNDLSSAFTEADSVFFPETAEPHCYPIVAVWAYQATVERKFKPVR